MLVRYEPDLAKERKGTQGKCPRMDSLTERRTDGRPDNYRALSEQGTSNVTLSEFLPCFLQLQFIRVSVIVQNILF